MTALQDIIHKVDIIDSKGPLAREINALQFDSRKVEANDIFVAVKGTQVDGHRFIENCIAQGATVIVCEIIPKRLVPILLISMLPTVRSLWELWLPIFTAILHRN
jgi:UDP-N-acetylmuramoyl-L-alanyl-D-glutamate--2,6-diaminopimelate ligase